MKVIKYLESKLAYPRAMLVILVLVLVISMVGLIYSGNRNSKIKKYLAEQSLAMQYDSKIRDSLFSLVLDEGNTKTLNALSRELYRTRLAVQARLLLRSDEMSSEWKNLYSFNRVNLGELLTDSFVMRYLSNFIINLASQSKLTDEEIKVLNSIKNVWHEVDELSRNQKLHRVSIGISAHNTTYYGKISSGPWITNIDFRTPEADKIAEHGYQLIKDLLSLPRTLTHFLGRGEEVSEINISERVLSDKYYSGDSIQQFKEIMRNYSFTMVEDQSDFKPLYYINVYQDEDGRMNPFLMEVGEKYIRISQTIHYFPYQKYKDQTELWKEWLYKVQIDGMYESSPQLIEDIKDFVSSNK